MDQLESNRRYSETSETHKAPHSPTFGQLLQGDASWQFSTSPTLARNHDLEEDFSPHSNKKSVFARVKERAKQLRHSLSAKKRHDNEIHDGHSIPSWGVSLEDDDDDDDDEEDEDPEYLGAPMYESELAPEVCKETARQHPRANPVVSEKHIWPASIKHEDEEKHTIHNKTITETMSEKLAPAYAAVSDATHTIASRIAGLTISVPEEQQKHADPDTQHSTVDGMKNLGRTSEIRENLSHKSPQKWDKGVSVKEYFMNKLEPGEDDRALSQVISEAISPKKTLKAVSPKKTPNDMGMVEKMREAVTSFLRHEEPSQSAAKGSMVPESSRQTSKANVLSNIPISTKTKVPPPNSTCSTNINSSPHVPVSHDASSIEESSKETIKATNLSSITPISTKTEVLPQHSIYPTNVKSLSHVPMSRGASSMGGPSKDTIKATSLSSNAPISNKVEVPLPNFISSTNANSSSNAPMSLGARSIKEPSKETIKATNLSSNFPITIRTEVPPLNSISSANINSSSRVPISRSVSLSSHVPVSKSANSSPLIPISTNAGVIEEETHGRILQAN